MNDHTSQNMGTAEAVQGSGFKTLDEVREAIKSGRKLCWQTTGYEGKVDDHGQYFVVCSLNGRAAALTDDYRAEDFHEVRSVVDGGDSGDTAPSHTPGPWAVERPYGEPGVYISRPETTELVARVFVPDAGEEALTANARLIAAAPELLGQFRMLVEGLAAGVPIPADGAAVNAGRELLAGLGINVEVPQVRVREFQRVEVADLNFDNVCLSARVGDWTIDQGDCENVVAFYVDMETGWMFYELEEPSEGCGKRYVSYNDLATDDIEEMKAWLSKEIADEFDR